MLKRIIAVLAGVIAGVAVVFLMDMVSHALFPLPTGTVLPTTHEGWEEIMKIVPPGALAVVLLGGFLSGITAGLIASVIRKDQTANTALIAGTILTILGALNAFGIPHPIWFRIGSLIVYLAGAYIGSWIYSKTKKNA